MPVSSYKYAVQFMALAALQPFAAEHGSAVICLALVVLPDMTVAHSSRNLK